MRGRWGQKSRRVYLYVYWKGFDNISRGKQSARKNIRCLYTCHAHTLAQPTLLFLNTPYTCALAYILTLHEPTNARPYSILQTNYTLNTYPTNTYLLYIHTLPLQTYKTYIPSLPLHTYTTSTTSTTQHTLRPTLHAGPTPAHLLNGQVVKRCGYNLLLI